MEGTTEFSFLGADLRIEDHFFIDLNASSIPISSSPKRMQNGIICIFLEGHILIQVDGVRYTMEKGMILSVFPHQIAELIDEGLHLKLMCFTCSDEVLKRILFRIPPEFEFFLKEFPTYKLREDMVEYFRGIFQLMYGKFMDSDNISRNEIILSLVRLFYLEIYNKIRQKINISPRRQIRKHEIFRDFINLLIRDCRNYREVQYYAEKLNITPKYLSAATQEVDGKGAKKIIDNFIVMEIKLLLQTTDLNIQEIMNKFNFPDQAFFTKFFKTHTGYTPNQYRNK